MIVAIVGSREYPDLSRVRGYVHTLPPHATIVSGGARGVDRVAVDEARQRGMATVVIPADWRLYGRSAGFRRNYEIVARADRIVAFWDGRSRGTQHTIETARAAGKPVEVIGM